MAGLGQQIFPEPEDCVLIGGRVKTHEITIFGGIPIHKTVILGYLGHQVLTHSHSVYKLTQAKVFLRSGMLRALWETWRWFLRTGRS